MKTTGSLLAGLITTFMLSTAVDVALHATGVFPPFGQPMSNALPCAWMGGKLRTA